MVLASTRRVPNEEILGPGECPTAWHRCLDAVDRAARHGYLDALVSLNQRQVRRAMKEATKDVR